MTLDSQKAAIGPHVLVVDDDFRLLVSLRRGLALRGFEVECSETLPEAVSHLESGWPEVVVLDVGMPGMDGITFCRLIRDRFATPILMLTARDAIEDKVAGLEAGADDYLVKPFALDELVARLGSLLRRAVGHAPSGAHAFQDLKIDPVSWTAERGGEPLDLTSIEFRILEALLNPPGSVRTREELLTAAWNGPDSASSNVVDVHIANLRRKTEMRGRSRIIQTVRRVGYKLQASE